MDKKKTSKKRGFCFDEMPIVALKPTVKTTEHHPEEIFRDVKKVGAALLECLLENDVKAFLEILDGFLLINRMKVAKKAKLARSTVQQALSGKGNPTLKTLAKIVH